ncbi:MAG: restriction endonuclease subunit S [Saprospiraceae bacterium]
MAELDAYIPIELYEEYKKKYSFPKIGDILISASGTIGRLAGYDGSDAYYQDSNIVWLGHNEKKY